jgi:ABC-type multidrug transport system fused ATPase/permease subunit
VDPFACFGNYGIATNFLTTISFPFEVATFVLITFYWFEAVTNASITVYPFVDRFKPFFFAFTIIFIAVIILVSVLGYFLAFSITTPVIIIYVIVSIAFLIFYIVTVIKIVKKIAKSNNLRQKKTKALTEVNTKIILNGVIRVLSLIPVIIYVSPDIATVPLPQLVGSVFIYAMILLDSWARIYLFKEPRTRKSTTGSNSKKSEASGFTGSTAKAEMGDTQAPDTQV